MFLVLRSDQFSLHVHWHHASYAYKLGSINLPNKTVKTGDEIKKNANK